MTCDICELGPPSRIIPNGRSDNIHTNLLGGGALSLVSSLAVIPPGHQPEIWGCGVYLGIRTRKSVLESLLQAAYIAISYFGQTRSFLLILLPIQICVCVSRDYINVILFQLSEQHSSLSKPWSYPSNRNPQDPSLRPKPVDAIQKLELYE